MARRGKRAKVSVGILHLRQASEAKAAPSGYHSGSACRRFVKTNSTSKSNISGNSGRLNLLAEKPAAEQECHDGSPNCFPNCHSGHSFHGCHTVHERTFLLLVKQKNRFFFEQQARLFIAATRAPAPPESLFVRGADFPPDRKLSERALRSSSRQSP